MTSLRQPSHTHLGRTKFETELQVRPDDLDMFRHVHSSRYIDYVLAARFEQMERCYKMSMQEFLKLGFGWVVRTAKMDFKRPLGLAERFLVRTWIQEIHRDSVRVDFEILKLPTRKTACDGNFDYTLINLASGRAEPIPDWIVEKYAI